MHRLNKENIPEHIAIVMDGNGRWAKKHGLKRIFGHRYAIDTVRKVVECAGEIGVKYLTLYTFSSENWNRPQDEVHAIMDLLVSSIEKEIPALNKNNVKLASIGDVKKLPPKAQQRLQNGIETLKNNTGLTLVLALSYGSRDEIIEAAKRCAALVSEGKLKVEDINEKVLSDNMYTAGIPDPDLWIRTSGELRLSNFLLWQSAYSELYFTDVLWPDFSKEDLINAIYDYQHRERRFGKTSEQIKK